MIGRAIEGLQGQANDKRGKIIVLPLFSGNNDNEKLSMSDRKRLKPDVAVFEEHLHPMCF